MIFGVCPKCGSSKLPVKNGELVQHMGSKKPCDWAIPASTQEGIDLPYVTNPHLSFFQNMQIMLDLLEEA